MEGHEAISRRMCPFFFRAHKDMLHITKSPASLQMATTATSMHDCMELDYKAGKNGSSDLPCQILWISEQFAISFDFYLKECGNFCIQHATSCHLLPACHFLELSRLTNSLKSNYTMNCNLVIFPDINNCTTKSKIFSRNVFFLLSNIWSYFLGCINSRFTYMYIHQSAE
jgi:hypothetical protein